MIPWLDTVVKASTSAESADEVVANLFDTLVNGTQEEVLEAFLIYEETMDAIDAPLKDLCTNSCAGSPRVVGSVFVEGERTRQITCRVQNLCEPGFIDCGGWCAEEDGGDPFDINTGVCI
ncbi:MAG: hypothetical protein KUG77_03940 [Nannocystaceae bacterium]|nr:hypothetical protein [Nannocystaceae bacterium]